MRKIKKYLSAFLAGVILAPSSTHTSTYANSKKVTVLVPKSSVTVSLRKSKKMEEKIKKLSKHLNKNYNVPILDGGSYGNTARSDGYECHHLISSHFCKKHRHCISRYQAPSVLIPKEVHRLTGSHPRSGHMRCYFKREKILYREWGLHGVVALGMMDLIHAFKKYYEKYPHMRPVKSDHVTMQTPVKNALAQLQVVSPNRIPFTPSNFETPKREKVYPEYIYAIRRLIFDETQL